MNCSEHDDEHAELIAMDTLPRPCNQSDSMKNDSVENGGGDRLYYAEEMMMMAAELQLVRGR